MFIIKPVVLLTVQCLNLICLKEFFYICRHKINVKNRLITLVGSQLFLLATFTSTHVQGLEKLPALIALLTATALFCSYFTKIYAAIKDISLSILGFCYITLPLSCSFLILYNQPKAVGPQILIFTIFVSKVADMGAYVAGKLFGNLKLARDISPNKSIEGAIGGILASMITGYFLSDFVNVNLFFTLLLSLGLSLLAQFGDLAESLLKRDGGVKDSSLALGFGGILDMIDSLLFSLPFIYILLELKIIWL